MSKVIEFIRFMPEAGAPPETLFAAARRADALFARMPGLLRRTLLGPDEGGFYTDVVEWKDEASAIASQKTAHEQPAEAAEYFAMVDMATMSFQRLRVQIDTTHHTG